MLFRSYMQKVYKDPGIALSTRDFEEPSNYDPNRYTCIAEIPASPVQDSTATATPEESTPPENVSEESLGL